MSPSPGNVPAVILTVAPVRFKLSGSETARLGESVTLWNCVSVTADATELNEGALLIGLTVTVVVCEPGGEIPSLADQVIVRVVFDPKFVGLLLVDEKTREART
jgi:hypothetical protein